MRSPLPCLFARVAAGLAIAAVAPLAGSLPAAAQSDPAAALASRSAIVVLGTVTRVEASDEPLLAPSPATVVIKIDRMVAGSELAGDQTGHTATVILSRPGSLKVGSQALFFGNPRFLGKTITIADEGELPAPAADQARSQALEQGMRARRDAPLRARLASAVMVFRGTVEKVRPLLEAEPRGKRTRERDEHDPEWQVATVRVASAVRGPANGAVVPVVFAASRDILWFQAPKLHPGETVMIVGQRPREGETGLLPRTPGYRFVQEKHAVLVTSPFDVLPVADEKRVTDLLHQEVPR
jgi:hypothetical protein